jgi:hypothetical protein
LLDALGDLREWWHGGSLATRITLDLAQRPRAGVLHRPDPPDEKPHPGKEAAKEAKPSRAAEVRRTIEEYANNLREIIKKLRGRLN